MRCPSCRHDNPADAAFCTGCGSPLEIRCPRCGRGSPPGSRLADECLAVAERSESRKNIVKARRLRAQARLAGGALALAETDLDAALTVAIETENPPQLWKTYAAFADLRRAQERPAEAREAAGEGLAVVEHVAAGLSDESLRGAQRLAPDRAVAGIGFEVRVPGTGCAGPVRTRRPPP